MSYTSHFSPYFVQSCFPFKDATSGPTSNNDSLVYFPYPTSRHLSSILDRLAQNSVFCFPLFSSFTHRHSSGLSSLHTSLSRLPQFPQAIRFSMVTGHPLTPATGWPPQHTFIPVLKSCQSALSSADITSHSIFTLPNMGSRISDAILEICKFMPLLPQVTCLVRGPPPLSLVLPLWSLYKSWTGQ